MTYFFAMISYIWFTVISSALIIYLFKQPEEEWASLGYLTLDTTLMLWLEYVCYLQ